MTKTTDELLPCPFCGLEELEWEHGEQDGDGWILCMNCGAQGPYDHHLCFADAWNVRKENHDWENVQKAVDALKFIKGIVEKGEQRKLDDSETIDLAIFNYVKDLEYKLTRTPSITVEELEEWAKELEEAKKERGDASYPEITIPYSEYELYQNLAKALQAVIEKLGSNE